MGKLKDIDQKGALTLRSLKVPSQERKGASIVRKLMKKTDRATREAF